MKSGEASRGRRLTGDRSTPASIGHGPVGDGGYAVVLSGLLLVPLLIFTSFAVDVGSWYAQGVEQQRAADAAALAAVVWADNPSNPTLYQTVGLETAQRNGFQHGVGGVSVSIDRISGNRVQATITAPRQRYFSSLFYPASTLTRRSVAEYVLPVPLGSPRNFIGTGDFGLGSANTPYEMENLWMAISGRCTDKQQGDRKAALKANNNTNNNCQGADNLEYSDINYEYYVELPTNRTYDTDVLIFSGNMMNVGTSSTQCNTPGTWDPDGSGPLPAEPVNVTNEMCFGGLASQPVMPTTFTLYQADSTPLDDSDNPPMTAVNGCTSGFGTGTGGQKTFNPITTPNQNTTAEHNYPSAGTAWNPAPGQFRSRLGWWRLCTIPASAPAGKYILRVRNQSSPGGAASNNNGSNAYSIVANRSTNPGLCDYRTDSTCPRVYAKDFMSVYARSAGTAQFFLAEVGPQHAGKQVEVQLWDAAEGAQSLRIKRPNGCNSWVDETFDFRVNSNGTGGIEASGTGVQVINIAGYDFNNDLITINWTLPASWNPPACNQWYRVEYTYSASATDRTTWSLKIIGDPVHLVA
ncbi:MAG: pilus assembly protein TadG-related protein [Acidimicrobiales bacterium]|nr:pilus assembly protein TadG-related protein [Acidimicrobiales bacterium]